MKNFKKYLKTGNPTDIAKVAKCTPQHVRLVLRGKRNSDTEKGKKIMEAAKRLAEFRATFQSNKNRE